MIPLGASSWIEFVFWSLDRLGLAVPEPVLRPAGAALAVLGLAVFLCSLLSYWRTKTEPVPLPRPGGRRAT
jgi:hypothetical protein